MDRLRIMTLAVAATGFLIAGSGCENDADDVADTVDTESSEMAEPTARVKTADIGEEPPTPEAGEYVVAMHVTDMTCSACAESVTAAATKVDGVERVRVSVNQDIAWFVLTQSIEVDTDAIAAAVEDAGFEVEPLGEPVEGLGEGDG
ncbi:MAG: heavy-metal-associated domain-containing protein [Phycisphaerales bacterium]